MPWVVPQRPTLSCFLFKGSSALFLTRSTPFFSLLSITPQFYHDVKTKHFTQVGILYCGTSVIYNPIFDKKGGMSNYLPHFIMRFRSFYSSFKWQIMPSMQQDQIRLTITMRFCASVINTDPSVHYGPDLCLLSTVADCGYIVTRHGCFKTCCIARG